MNTDPEFSPEEVLLEANLREFAHVVSMTCALEEGGKISPEEAFKRIRATWKQLKRSKKSLLDGE